MVLVNSVTKQLEEVRFHHPHQTRWLRCTTQSDVLAINKMERPSRPDSRHLWCDKGQSIVWKSLPFLNDFKKGQPTAYQFRNFRVCAPYFNADPQQIIMFLGYPIQGVKLTPSRIKHINVPDILFGPFVL